MCSLFVPTPLLVKREPVERGSAPPQRSWAVWTGAGPNFAVTAFREVRLDEDRGTSR